MKQDQKASTSKMKPKRGYEIQILGKLDGRWSEWFHGMELMIKRSGNRLPITIITCPSTDQALLRGILNKIWDLNLSLISVVQTPDAHSEDS